jgi:hypothetical protein
MRFLIPLALLATSAMAADKTAEDYLGDVIPQCVLSCWTDYAKTITGCDSLSDNDCVCQSIDQVMTSTDEDATNTLTSCMKEQGTRCGKEDAEKLKNFEDPSKLTDAVSEFQSSCPDTGMLSPVSC